MEDKKRAEAEAKVKAEMDAKKKAKAEAKSIFLTMKVTSTYDLESRLVLVLLHEVKHMLASTIPKFSRAKVLRRVINPLTPKIRIDEVGY